MIETPAPSPTEAGRIRASCSTADGVQAFPPRRMVEVLRGVALRGASTTMQSICAGDFRQVIDRFIPLLGGWAWGLAGVCLPRPLAVAFAGRPDCNVEELLPPAERGAVVTTCADLADAGAFLGAEVDGLGRTRERCAITRLTHAEGTGSTSRGWFYDISPAVISSCGASAPPGQRISFTNHQPPGGTEIRIRCRSPIPAFAEDGGAPLSACEP